MKRVLNELEKITLLGVKQVLTTEDVMMLTGLSVSTLHRLTCEKKFPYYKSRGGKRNYYNKDEVTKWMLDSRVKTSAEVEEEALAYVASKN